jgi:hypothetical protein
MTQLHINEIAVGEGKSLHWIAPAINYHLSRKEHVLQVLTSINSQEETKVFFPNAHVINCQDGTDKAAIGRAQECITSKKYRHIIITHATFMQLQISNISVAGWVVMVDEMLTPIRSIIHDTTPTKKSSPFNRYEKKIAKPFDWTSIIKLGEPSKAGYHTVRTEVPSNDAYLSQILELHQLADPNWTTYIKKSQYDRFGKENCRIEFFQVLNTDVMSKWNKVYVAAANLSSMVMNTWLDKPEYDVVERVHFEKKPIKLTIYTTMYTNSIAMQKKYPQFMENYHREFEKVIAGKQVLLVSNNHVNPDVLDTGVESGVTKLKHNMHGINEYRNSHTVVSFESALNRSNAFIAWARDHEGIGPQVLFDTFTTDKGYQLVGRTSHREAGNKEEIIAGIPCLKTAKRLAELYFDAADVNIVVLPVTLNLPERATTYTKSAEQIEKESTKPKFTAAQQCANTRYKRKVKDASEIVGGLMALAMGSDIDELFEYSIGILDLMYQESIIEYDERVLKRGKVEDTQLIETIPEEPVVDDIMSEMTMAEKIAAANPNKNLEIDDYDVERSNAIAKLKAMKSRITEKPVDNTIESDIMSESIIDEDDYELRDST